MSEQCSTEDVNLSSDDSSLLSNNQPTSTSLSTPPPKCKKATTSHRQHKRGRRVKRSKRKQSKRKRKRAASSSSSSSRSHASTDSDLPSRRTSRRCRKYKLSSSKLCKNASREPTKLQLNFKEKLVEIFQYRCNELSKAFSSCLVTMSNILFSKQIISRDAHAKNLDSSELDVRRAAKLVLCVQDWLYNNAEKWPELIQCLSEEGSLKSIMEEIGGNIGGVCSKVTSGSTTS